MPTATAGRTGKQTRTIDGYNKHKQHELIITLLMLSNLQFVDLKLIIHHFTLRFLKWRS